MSEFDHGVQDPPEQLLSLNQRFFQPLLSLQLTAAPGIPPIDPHRDQLITSDVIEPVLKVTVKGLPG